MFAAYFRDFPLCISKELHCCRSLSVSFDALCGAPIRCSGRSPQGYVGSRAVISAIVEHYSKLLKQYPSIRVKSENGVGAIVLGDYAVTLAMTERYSEAEALFLEALKLD